MRVPLDYYRILGLPPNFFQPMSAEQLQQAYRDRTAQLPQREYSLTAIEIRNQLISLAYRVLSDPQQRQRYDAEYRASADELANSGVMNGAADGEFDEDANAPSKSFERNFELEPETDRLSIEIADDLLIGALIILQDAGECELVLNLGQSFLSNSDLEVDSDAQSDRPDIVLAVALAYLQQGREQWQNDRYENAAVSLQAGYSLLERERLFPDTAAEIAADLEKLRPYRILELVSQPESHIAERQRGLQLLQEMLRDRQGIEGTGNDGSGLSIEDFLGFIQQLRDYLTAAEQQSLFEAESQRPSAVATYLAVYASIARGFAARMPALIHQAKILLLRLGKRQDLYLEQAICSLLLGQTVEATEALQHSQEQEPLAVIRKNSQGAPDLLPGLCLYSETWLQTEVFPHFRDLATRTASLKDYFADPGVQEYLEALPSQPDYAIAEYQFVAPADRATDGNERVAARNGQRQAIAASAATSRGAGELEVRGDENSSQGTVAVLSNPEPVTASSSATKTTSGVEKATPPRQRRNSKNRPPRRGSYDNGKDRPSGALGFGSLKIGRLAILLGGGALGLAVLWFLASQIFALFHRTATPPIAQQPPVVSEQLVVELNQPPVAIPRPQPKPAVPKPLNRDTAAPVVQAWLAAKAAAFGSEHTTDKLKQILVEPALSQWQKRVQDDLLNRRVRRYKHSLQVNGVKNDPKNSDRAQVDATVVEVAQVYERNRLNRAASYNEKLRVQYNLVRQNGNWRIQTMQVLK
ncbi:molecular chaperone DnaJ [Chroococcidiopsis sp. CCALA 051]|uniref:IMS domain-containing protein n=1 Tax=Chroococcidiopsis sp. CCALA 051 TaxID=869949 RepID=UPI000D0CBAD0|nr:IMS domain-containing protein [Chroococcidiopsis sp. CCALA 051]PSM46274.1 molecular chaperone DnaJ [Chroococcidiopsis sp. CCALA 051]